MADEHQAKGNEFFRNDRFDKALECYTKAIELDQTQGALYSNRSACYAELEKWTEAPPPSPPFLERELALFAGGQVPRNACET
mmetsp:Transcript_8439/g.21886  ORF Transcript_8439/g.21886 Transcript_8439/m.21886 type:complete len:83 (-) Transcript_8439:1516-1764(-)